MTNDSLEPVLKLNKSIGETPLECINRYKAENPEYQNSKTAYAGRLDPMAEGLLLVLVGDECKNRDEYQGMDKVYEFDVLLGVSTDTYDTLGIVNDLEDKIVEKVPLSSLPNNLSEVLEKVSGITEQEYPAYSSFHVEGKPLWWWAKNNKLGEIEIPKKEVEIKDFKVNRVYEITAEELLDIVKDRTGKVTGDFRQDEIIESWEKNLSKFDKGSILPILSFEVEVTSGTYVRSIAKYIGEILGVPSLAYRIQRTSIGEYKL